MIAQPPQKPIQGVFRAVPSLARPIMQSLFWCAGGELETARRWGIRTVTDINNNQCFGQSIPGMMKAYSSDQGNPDQIVRFEKIDFAHIAEEFGCMGIRVEEPDQIAPAFQAAWKADRPVVIDVATNPECHPPPAIWHPNT